MLPNLSVLDIGSNVVSLEQTSWSERQKTPLFSQFPQWIAVENGIPYAWGEDNGGDSEDDLSRPCINFRIVDDNFTPDSNGRGKFIMHRVYMHGYEEDEAGSRWFFASLYIDVNGHTVVRCQFYTTVKGEFGEDCNGIVVRITEVGKGSEIAWYGFGANEVHTDGLHFEPETLRALILTCPGFDIPLANKEAVHMQYRPGGAGYQTVYREFTDPPTEEGVGAKRPRSN